MIDNTELVDFETYRFPNLKFKLTKEDLKELKVNGYNKDLISLYDLKK